MPQIEASCVEIDATVLQVVYERRTMRLGLDESLSRRAFSQQLGRSMYWGPWRRMTQMQMRSLTMEMREMKQRMKMGLVMQQMTWQMHCPSKLRSSERSWSQS